MIRNICTPALVFASLVLSACQAPGPMNQGQSGGRLDPTHDAPGELGSRSPRSQDLVTASDRMAQDIATRLDITNRSSPPRIFVGKIENRSSMAHQNFQVFLARVRSTLQASGARSGLEFVREREYIEDQRAREYGNERGSSAAEYSSRADYVLTCEIFDLPSGRTNYFLFDYQLVQLRAANTGPDIGPGAIVWENMYEVKFQ